MRRYTKILKSFAYYIHKKYHTSKTKEMHFGIDNFGIKYKCSVIKKLIITLHYRMELQISHQSFDFMDHFLRISFLNYIFVVY